MDLFGNNIHGQVNRSSIDWEQQKERKRSLTTLSELRQRFIRAIKLQEREVLNFLLSDEQYCDYWKSKKEFVDKFFHGLYKLQGYQPLDIVIKQGISLDKEVRNKSFAVSVEVKSHHENRLLWNFNLAYRFDTEHKIKVIWVKTFCAFVPLPPKSKEYGERIVGAQSQS